MRPDTALFHHHVMDAEFQAGVDRHEWGIYEENHEYPTWPIVIIWIQALSKEPSLEKYYFRFDLSGYPVSAPTACPWDVEFNRRLDNSQWPRGQKLVSATFNYGWNPNALYAPCDRVAMAGHDVWSMQHPDLWWLSTFKITVYLNFLHRLLNSADYAKA
jgi:hypothetical protein